MKWIFIILFIMATEKEILADLDNNTKKYIKVQFNETSQAIDITSPLLINETKKYIINHPNFTKEAIKEILEKDLKDVTGIFSFYRQEMLKQIKLATYNIQDDIFYRGLEQELGYNERTLYTWSARMVRTCPSCITLHGQTKTMKQWRSDIGVPREANTICGANCKCQLIPTDVIPSRAEMHKPLMVQSDRIRRAEKKRGKKYSDSYKLAILGNTNNPNYPTVVKNLRTIKKVK